MTRSRELREEGPSWLPWAQPGRPKKIWGRLLESTNPTHHLRSALGFTQPGDTKRATQSRKRLRGHQHRCNQLLPGPFHAGTRCSYLRPEHLCGDPKLGASHKRTPRAALEPRLEWLGLHGARANTTNAVSLKPLQCRCCFHGN